jgi:myo-inositol-1(or 4)-monophosphatase
LELMEIAIQVARAAGSVVEGAAAKDRTAALTKSSRTDVATAMDLKSERLITEMLHRRRPQDGIFGEEGARGASESGVTWVVDPIDGTVNYLYGLPAYAVSIAAVTGEVDPTTWTPLAGCVYAPAMEVTWWAARGHGAFRDGHPIHVAEPVPPEMSLTGTGFGYRPEVRARQVAKLATIIDQIRDIRRMGSAAIDLCHVAEGRLDAYFEIGLQPWDMAAGVLVVTEAGGAVMGLDGGPASDRLTVAGPEPTARWLSAHLSLCTHHG